MQLLRLRDAFTNYNTAYVSMFENYSSAVPGARLYTVPDASRFSKASFVKVAFRALAIMLKERPHAIVTTGSAPMLCSSRSVSRVMISASCRWPGSPIPSACRPPDG